jgi:hypothetical protein
MYDADQNGVMSFEGNTDSFLVINIKLVFIMLESHTWGYVRSSDMAIGVLWHPKLRICFC